MAELDESKANEGCVGPSSAEAGKAAACEGCPNQSLCASGAGQKEDDTPDRVRERLRDVKHKILVLSGKGGVGKSTVACQLAMALASRGASVGLLDVDICGPSVPRMLGLQGRVVHNSGSGWSPVYVEHFQDLGVMSVGFLLPEDDKAIIWRGPRKNGLIKQFLTDVDWGDLDFLVIDTPPGTSDEHISMAQYLKSAEVSGCVVVTTPQEISMQDVRKELNFCEKTKMPILGVVENMAHLAASLANCTLLDENTGENLTRKVKECLPKDLFDCLQVQYPVFEAPAEKTANAQHMAVRYGTNYLGAIPLDPDLGAACDKGRYVATAFPDAPAAKAFDKTVDAVLRALGLGGSNLSSAANPFQYQPSTF